MVVRRNHRVFGLTGINEDAQAALAAEGIKGTCRFVAYTGPITGGANLCDVEGTPSGPPIPRN